MLNLLLDIGVVNRLETTTDFSDEMTEIARTRLEGFQNITVEKANCINTSFPSGRFDTVFMANLIHIIENPQEALKESWRF